jgi:hypothetical protein
VFDGTPPRKPSPRGNPQKNKRRPAHPPGRPRRCIQHLQSPIPGGCASQNLCGPRTHAGRPPSLRRQTTPRLPVETRLAAFTPPPGEGASLPPRSSRRERPVRAFVVASRPAPPGRANGAVTALPPCRPAPAGSYSPPAPSARHLKHPEDRPGTGGTTPGRRAPSQVSVRRLSAGHVARGNPRTGWRAACPHAGTVCAGPVPSRGRTISGGRIQKHPPTRPPGLFAVRPRVSGRISPASPCGPFEVELFAAPGLPGGPRAWSRPGPGCRQPGTPLAGTVERT